MHMFEAIQKPVFEALNSNSNSHWFCDSCNDLAMSLIKHDSTIKQACERNLQSFTQRIESIEDTILHKANTDDVAQLQERIQLLSDKVDQQTAGKQPIPEMKTFIKNQQKMNEEMQKKLQDQSSNAAKVSVKELRDREERKSNLILFNMPESTSEDITIRKEEDQKHLTELCKILEVEHIFVKPVRLGKKTEKNRPLKITASDPSATNDLLRAAKKLANVEDSSIYKKVGINKDMTFLEREERRALVKEKNKKMQEAADRGQHARWIIRNGSLINLVKYGQNQKPVDVVQSQEQVENDQA